MDAEHLETVGWDLADSGRRDLLQKVGARIWHQWAQDIAVGKHPRRSALLAFLRVWVAPLSNWLPHGMAHYLADRLDPEVATPGPVGRPRLSSKKKTEKLSRDESIALDVLVSWRENKKSKTHGPQRAAIEGVAERWGLHEVDVKFAFRDYRENAEILAKLRAGASWESLSHTELNVLCGEPDYLWRFVLLELTDDELRRIAAGESRFRVLGR
jgi:hypothetical protein